MIYWLNYNILTIKDNSDSDLKKLCISGTIICEISDCIYFTALRKLYALLS